MTEPRPMTNDELIAKLLSVGVRATACSVCGKVKEVVDDRVVIHYSAIPPILCGGSDMDLLGDVEHVFEQMVADVEVPRSPEDYGAMAAHHAVETLTGLIGVVEKGMEIEGPSGEPFCGCIPCVVREVMYAVWGFATHAQFVHIVDFLTAAASKEGEKIEVRKAAQMLAEAIIEEHSGPEDQ